MGAAIGPGDFVECIALGVSLEGFVTGYVIGAAYLVSEIGCDERGPWLNCVGMPRPKDVGFYNYPGWDFGAFRPIYRPKSEIIESLKAPAPKELEPA